MKEQRNVLKFIVPMMVLALACVIICELSLIPVCIRMKHIEFIKNAFIGIFSSAFLLTITSLISYFIQKKEALNSYWLTLSSFNQTILAFAMLHFQQYSSCAKNDEEVVKIVKDHLNSIGYALAADVIEIEDKYAQVNLAHSKISFTVKRKNDLFEIIETSFSLAGDINREITNLFNVATNQWSDDTSAIIEFAHEKGKQVQLSSELKKLANKLEIKIEKK